MRTGQKQTPTRRGATIVEATFVLSILIVLMFGLYEFGRAVMMRHLVDNAAREGARMAVVNTEVMTITDVEDRVKHYLADRDFQGVTIQVYKIDPATGANLGTWTDAGFGESIAVQIDASYRPILKTFSLMPDPVPLRSLAVMRCEAN